MKAEIQFEAPYALPVVNSPRSTRLLQRIVQEHLPELAWRELDKPSMGNEDFAFYLSGREGAMFMLGQGENSPGLHHSSFDFNGDTLRAGILTFALLTLGYNGH